MTSLAVFHEPVRVWFESAFAAPTNAQARAFPSIASGASTLLLAPTGAGKTLAAFLAALDRLAFSEAPEPLARCRVLYVSPLKALAFDVERNLRAPLAGIAAAALKLGVPATDVHVDVRTGDTPAKDRARMNRHPPDILVTTPESLYLLLTSKARAMLAHVDTVIIDEIHSVVPTKRGAHLFFSLERLEALRRAADPKKKPLQRIGLSATQRPLDEVARLLGGFDGDAQRPVTIVDAGAKRAVELTVEVPIDDMSKLGEREEVAIGPAAALPPRRSIWPAIHPRLVELIRQNRTTMIFVNSRRLAERLSTALNEVAGEEIAACHHGSIAREKRLEIEDRLKRGALPAIVATSSLELGIDMGSVDLVVQIEAPPSVASGLQRVGRAGHSADRISRGIVFPKHRGDLVACAAAAVRMRDAEVEETFYPRSPLDILAQQIVAHVAVEDRPIAVDELFALARGAASFHDLPRGAFDGVLDMLAGRYPSDDFAELKARLVWDRALGTVRPRPGAQRLAIVSGGTIPDRGLYGVFLATGEGPSRRVGELDEEMVFESREGEVFLLGTSAWRIEEIAHDRVLVTPAPGEVGKMPFWRGDKVGRPAAFGEAIGAFCRELAALEPAAAERQLVTKRGLDARAAKNLVAYLREQVEATGEVPSDKTIIVERYEDDLGDTRLCILSPFGGRVHAPWATAIAARLRARSVTVDALWTDDGIVLRLPETEQAVPADDLFLGAAEARDLVIASLAESSLFASKFRECSGRALLLPRKLPGKRTALWAQRKRAADLLAVASRYPSFPMILEAYRDCLQDTFDVPALIALMRKIERREVRVISVETKRPSPFSQSLMFAYTGEFLYEGDAPLAERKAQALRVDQAQLRALLGDAELRQLLDPEVLASVESELQRVTGKRKARDAEDVADMHLALGDLSEPELAARCIEGDRASAYRDELLRTRRLFAIRVAGETRTIAGEDMGRYRDALGVAPPPGVPAAFLEAAPRALVDLIARFARTHGPFTLADVIARFGLAASAAAMVLQELTDEGRLVEGEFLPKGRGLEHCDAGVLRMLRQRSLAKLRDEIAPVEGAQLAVFLPSWQGVGAKRRGQQALLAIIDQLEGAPIPASVLERDVIPARLVGYAPADLDALFLSGEIVWAGIEPLGPSDGRLALYAADHEALLARDVKPVEGDLHARIRGLLEARGALFFVDIVREAAAYPPDARDAIWDLVWAGELTNDTLAPVRSLFRAAEHTRRGTRPGTGPRLPGTEGRWALRRCLRQPAPKPAEKATALARTLLARYGLLTRESVHAEGIYGGFSAVYPILRGLEERGQARRGYFVAGCGAAQFALPGADDRLRAVESDAEVIVLASTDPAQPYGAALPWPEVRTGARPGRTAGAYVLLHRGVLLGVLGRGGKAITTFFPLDEPDRSAAMKALATGLARLADAPARRALVLATVDGAPTAESAFARSLVEAGFGPSYLGYQKRKSIARVAPTPELVSPADDFDDGDGPWAQTEDDGVDA